MLSPGITSGNRQTTPPHTTVGRQSLTGCVMATAAICRTGPPAPPPSLHLMKCTRTGCPLSALLRMI